MARDVSEVIERALALIDREMGNLESLPDLDRDSFKKLTDGLQAALAVSKDKRERLLQKLLSKMDDQTIDRLIANAPKELFQKQS